MFCDRVTCLALATAMAGCSGPELGTDLGPFGAPVTSESGALTVSMTSAPEQVPVRGINQVEVEIRRTETGAAADGLELSMTPFMPAMGHGSSTVPSVSPTGGGRYRFDDVSLSMPGLWELRISIVDAKSDYVAPRFEVE